MSGKDDSASYGLLIGFIFTFNIIVGTGALAMPLAFLNSGIILSTFLLLFLTLMSFITATFMFEAMAIANAIKNAQKSEIENDSTKFGYINPASDLANESNESQAHLVDPNNEIINEDRPLIAQNQSTQSRVNLKSLNNNSEDEIIENESNMFASESLERRHANKLFSIKNKFEMGDMAGLFFSKIGQLFFYLAMILYLYGDLIIYDATVPKSLRDTTCTYTSEKNNTTLADSDPCWPNVNISRMNAYRIYVVLFNLLIGPLVFYNLQKTKLLQLATTILRWLAFITMISLAVIKINDNSAKSQTIKPSVFDFKGLPNFFGVCIYAFMCHHSLPSIITPIRNKEKFKFVLIGAYSCIVIFYMLLSYTGIFAFGKNLQDIYSFNFLPEKGKNQQSTFMKVIDYYLSLFPVFTISASFPIIAITLRNNLKSLFFFLSGTTNTTPLSKSKTFFLNYGLPLVTLLPPCLISLITNDLQLLVGITGSYAGVAIQYVIPSCLVYFGRKAAIRTFRQNYQNKHSYTSPFKHKYWIFFVLLWSNVSVIFVTVYHIITGK